MSENNPPASDSPCTGECVINRDGYCKGCRRRITEIAGWQGLPESQRLRILAELPERRLRDEE